ncbi:MAG: branched-chain amino acid ABC transporter ATP-binding protein/permease [Proteobacteria bacterium]|nr:branched-chain amino acid ABC transporter ATP-binding protein/permease [Pseudomonadota bacterium]
MTRLQIAAVAAVIAALPLALAGQPYYSGLAAYAVILAIFGLSINLTVGYLGLISFGHAAFFGLGAYTAGLLVTKLGFNFWLALLVAPLPATILGALVGAATVRLGGAYFAIATLTAAEILRLVAANWLDLTRGPLGLIVPRPRIPAVESLGLVFAQYYLFICLVALVLCVELVRRLLRSPVGRGWQVIRESRDLAESIGIATVRQRTINIALSGGMAGLAGALFVPRTLVLTPDLFGATLSAMGLLTTILGGKATLIGSLLGGLTFAVLPEALRFVDEYRVVIFALILLLVIRVQPRGLVAMLPASWFRRGRAVALPEPRDAPIAFVKAEDLIVSHLTRRFGGLSAVSGVSLGLKPDELVGIIGPNGAGKTTCLSLISGFIAPTQGTVRFGTVVVSERPPHEMARAGLVRTFQQTAICPTLSVFENVLAATAVPVPEMFLDAILQLPSFYKRERKRRQIAADCLALVGLSSRAGDRAGSLPYGQQKLLSITVALATHPRLLLLDEPAAGLNHTEANLLGSLLKTLHGYGLTIALIDHNLRMMMALCQRIVVLDQGRLIADGTPDEVRANPQVVSAYLGGRSKQDVAS